MSPSVSEIQNEKMNTALSYFIDRDDKAGLRNGLHVRYCVIIRKWTKANSNETLVIRGVSLNQKASLIRN
jgi:hypothetical protein